MLSEELTDLKIKPLPKKNTEYNFFIEKKADSSLPSVIDKTKEKLIDPLEFIANISDKIALVNKDKMVETINKVKTEKQKEINDTIESKKIFSNKITNIEKTEEKITIKQLYDIDDDEIIKKVMSKTVKKSDYLKEYNFDGDVDLNKKLGKTTYKDRLPKLQEQILIKAPDYYSYNREKFIQFINNLFLPYKEELMQEEKDIADGKIVISCDNTFKSDFSLLIHQKIVRDYINIYTPFRGLLLYHGLGSGKTCSSIAIAEGIKHDKEIVVMTPASLMPNYVEELKKCGDYLYKKNQFWEFINTSLYPDEIKNISNLLKIPEKTIIENNGAWFVNVKKKPNYNELTFEEQKQINKQIDVMIANKYTFLKYNGLREYMLNPLSNNGKTNPFNNKVVIIDEVHNFISRIVNKLNQPKSLSMKLYKYLMEAENCKLVFLSGTPIINYPNEISILYNMLRGFINSYTCKFKKDASREKIESIIKKENLNKYIDSVDFIEKTKELTFTLNPFGYVNSSLNKNKLQYDNENIDNEKFIKLFIDAFKNNNIEIGTDNITITNYKALPDKLDQFRMNFINSQNKLQEEYVFKSRIIGLTSYFRSAQEDLMPKYDDNINIVKINMSDYQLGIYEAARFQERQVEQNSKKKKQQPPGEDDSIYDEKTSTYRIFSRAYCNFVFPDSIERPMPGKDDSVQTTLENIQENIKEDILENAMDIKEIKQKINNDDGNYEEEDIDIIKKEDAELKDKSYNTRIKDALKELQKNSKEFLSTKGLEIYSPKYLELLKNLNNSDNKGIHLLYSQFKTLEGIGIFKLVLKENNFAEFKLKKLPNGEYILDLKDEDIGKQMFASYSGDESPEEREIIKNVLNSNWDVVPSSIVAKIKSTLKNSKEKNLYGEVIKLLMITSSGAEGISLKNVRYVHILEPYWHHVRINQVIGRARRICSHSELPKELQTVDVFLYLMVFGDELLEKLSPETKLYDKSKREKSKVITSDEFLYEISLIKEELNKDILNNIKQASIDCSIHTRSSSKEKIQCFSIGNPSDDRNIYVPNISKQPKDQDIKLNKKTVALKLYKLVGTNYGVDKLTNEVYDYDAFEKGEIQLIGHLKKNEMGKNVIVLIK